MSYDAPYASESNKVLPPMPTTTPEPAPDSNTNVPPLPADGLPEGWTMTQWNHYGEQWLMNEQSSQTQVEAPQQTSEPQYVLSDDGYYYQYHQDGTYSSQAYIKAEDGTFSMYQ